MLALESCTAVQGCEDDEDLVDQRLCPSDLSTRPQIFPNNLYEIKPGAYTVYHHSCLNIEGLELTIDTRFHLLICITCGHSISPRAVKQHLSKHQPDLTLPSSFQADLISEFSLIEPWSLVAPREPVSPIFGIPVISHPQFFCECGRGYGSEDGLLAHQRSFERCPIQGVRGERALPKARRATGFG